MIDDREELQPITRHIEIKEAIVRDMGHGYREPFIRHAGHWYLIETKPSLLANNVATIIPVGPDWQTITDEAAWTGPRFVGQFLPVPEIGVTDVLFFQDAINSPEVVALARRFNELAESGQLQAGPLNLD